jgi:hypothetical protein
VVANTRAGVESVSISERLFATIFTKICEK